MTMSPERLSPAARLADSGEGISLDELRLAFKILRR